VLHDLTHLHAGQWQALIHMVWSQTA
jgi:hypothetical protein